MQNGPGTKELILDAAESLFSDKGVDGVSLRMLTREAGVNLAAVHYHFGSKEAVVNEVFLRRIRPLNRERLAMLDEVERRADHKLEDILAALLAPAIRLARDPERGRRFMRLCARYYSEPAACLEDSVELEFAEVIRRFEAAFAAALPHLARADLRRRMHFTIGVLVHTMLDSGRTIKWTRGACDPSNTDETLDSILQFVAAGMRAAESAHPVSRRAHAALEVTHT